jgi:hypothetical protein
MYSAYVHYYHLKNKIYQTFFDNIPFDNSMKTGLSF